MSADKIVAALTGDDTSLPTEAATLVVDHVLGLPLRDFVDSGELSQLCLTAMGEHQLQRAVERHIGPTVARLRKAVAGPGQTVGDAVPPELHDNILDLMSNPLGPRVPWLAGALDPALLRTLLAPVFQDVLLGFAGRIPAAVSSAATDAATAGAGALMGMLSPTARSGAGQLFNIGRSVVGGLGKDLEATVGPLAKDFSHSAVTAFQDSLRKRLRSTTGRELVSELQQGAFEHILAVELSVIDRDLDRLSMADLLALMPPTVAHNLGRQLGERALREAIEHYFEVEGDRSLSELLEDWGVRDDIRAIAIERGSPIARQLFGSDEFRSWLGSVLSAAGK